jgi:ligand-binding SRPBCC domain-containing protein
MQVILLKTHVGAPIHRCFDLSRSIDLHIHSARATGERAVGGVTNGLIKLGERVTWRARHFGIVFELTSLITEMDRPRFFRDRMVSGPFAFFEHDHSFDEARETTVITDEVRFRSPLGVVGRLSDSLIVARHLRRFLTGRNSIIKAIAESEDRWQRYV